MSKHDDLKQAAKDAINDLFSDQSVDKETTRDDLQEIVDDVEVMIDSIR